MDLYPGPAGNVPSFFYLEIACQRLHWRVSHIAEALSQPSAMLSNVRHLFIRSWYLKPNWRDDMDHIKWLTLLRRFTYVENLHVVHRLAGHVADALNDVTTELAPEILPALCLLDFVDEPAVHVEEFNTVRQLSGLPLVTITHTSDLLFPPR